MIKILIVIDYASEFSRNLMKGLIRYSKKNAQFIFYRLPSYYKTLHGKDGIVEYAKQKKADAIIALWDHEKTNRLEQLKIPILLQNYKERSKYYSNITGDYYGTGVMAAQFFIKRKFENFAFLGNKNAIWSRERALGFKNEIIKTSGKYFHFELEDLKDDEWSSNHLQLEEWLNNLPKPVALFACDDSYALQVSEICKINNTEIPKQLALLGVDNDELLCNLSDPPLSSIVLDVERGGYEAGRLIHQLIKKEKIEPFNIIIEPSRIELRQSTEYYNIQNRYIREVVEYILDNFDSKLTIDELTQVVPLSRRNLEIKFKEEMNTTIYQFILELRIDCFSKLLVTTNKSLFDISIEAGFNDCKNISRIFKKYKGVTPTEYRKLKKVELKDA